MQSENRVVVLIDMDCFYCQVEEKLDSKLAGKPIAVVQYNPWKGGGIIAVNYVARSQGVTRHMRGDEAKAKCPEIELPSVPCSRGKADITKYRDAGKDVARVLQRFTSLLERASIDEAYLDITGPVHKRLNSLNVENITADLMANTYALGYENVKEFLADVHSSGLDSIDFDYEHAKMLLVGAVIVSEIRTVVYEETGYRCSAGIAHNKILAKLVCGMNKPNKQTVLPKHCIDVLYKTLPLRKVKHLGGKFGDTVCQLLRITTMAELQTFAEKELQNKFDEKNGTWLYNIARGVDLEPVQARFNPKSIGCCKQFRGKACLLDLESVKKWLKDLGDEIEDRLEKDALESNRTPKQMVVSYSTRLNDGREISSSRSYNFIAEDELCGDLFSNKALELLMENSEGTKPKEGESNRRLKAPIEFLGISVGKFQDHTDAKKTRKINDYFSAGSSNLVSEKQSISKKNSKKENGKEYILQKFFQPTEKFKDENVAETSVTSVCNLQVVESSLEKQESFFAKILNKKLDSDSVSIDSDIIKAGKPNTPVCELLNCGEDSVDTECSGSTINMEINKSIALFEDDPKQVDKIDNMRQLLNSTICRENDLEEESSDITEVHSLHNDDTQENLETGKNTNTAHETETIDCAECEKKISFTMVDMHADYHLALKLREEERQRLRDEVKGKTKKNLPEKLNKNECKDKRKSSRQCSNSKNVSITRFFDKLDETLPTETCLECGKIILLEKLSEHLDFHEAQKLNRALNKKPAPYFTPSNASINKRKKKPLLPAKKSKLPNCKSIDSFFK